jgi:dolichyl-phosphate beta-glucosyltransferase
MLPNISYVTIVVPFFNEKKRLPVGKFETFIEETPWVRLCFVDDGSTDEGGELLSPLLKNDRVRLVTLPKNLGKAEAVRSGVLAALDWKGPQYVAFIDADLATPLDQVSLLIACLEKRPKAEFIFGSRVRRLGAQIDRRFVRHYLGRIFATFASLVLRLPVYDTQCGAKLFSARVARVIFGEKFLSRWFFDVELFARAATYFSPQSDDDFFLEIPLQRWSDVKGSKISFFHFFSVPWNLMLIRRKYRRSLKLLPRELSWSTS